MVHDTPSVFSLPLGGGNRSHVEWRPWRLALATLPNGEYHRVGYFEATSYASSAFRARVPQDITTFCYIP
jgi:hypothetical protein